VGATLAQLKEWKYANPTAANPGAEDQLNQCLPTPPGDQRSACYETVDKFLMENVVPWIPYRFANQVGITSPRVLNYHMNASSGWISLSLVALKNGGK
jgi:hypothetical protein